MDGYPAFRPDVASLWGKYLARNGVFCDISTTQLNDDISSVNWESGQCLLYKPPSNKILEQFGTFIHDCKVLWQSRHEQYDAIQVRDKTFICLMAVLFSRWRGVPFFYWMSYPMTQSLARLASNIDWKRNILRWIFLTIRGRLGGYVLHKIVLPQCDHIFVQSDRMLDDVAATGIAPSKMTAVPMCIDPERFAAPLPTIINERRVVGYLGECSRVRGIDFIFEALALIKLEIPDILLLVVGDAYELSDREWLRNCVEQLGLNGNVSITGWLSSEDALQVFSGVEVALALTPPDPLLEPATPTKLVEYLAMGRPVVGNDHPDQNFVITQSKGGLCVPFKVREYADAVLALLKDKDTCNQMAINGRQWVLQHRSYDKAAIRLKDVYFKLLDTSADD